MDKKVWEKVIIDFCNVRSFLTLGAFGIFYALIYSGKPIPEALNSFVFMLQGFWFGSKMANAVKPTEGETK